jgi:hypothetical protein
MPRYHRQHVSQWPYVDRPGHPSVAQFTPWGYPTIRQTNAYKVYGHPPRPRIVNNGLHQFLSIFTLGLWLPVWLVITVATHARNSRAQADYWSRIQRYYQWELAQRADQGG